jgi:CRISPR system Cascade subunit CasC
MSQQPRFLQIHTLTSYPASLLNRDDAGFAKRIPFGGATRTRISSQCLKRHWRVYDGEMSLKRFPSQPPESIRSRIAFEKHIVDPLVQEGIDLDVARAATEKLVGVLLGGDAKKEKEAKGGKKNGTKTKSNGADAKATARPPVQTAQVTVLGKPELDYLLTLARAACEGAKDANTAVKEIEAALKNKDLKKNIDALHPGKLEAGLGAALFGRMVTGDILSRTDAALHVAHAFTVHGQQSESDYFSAVDDLLREEGEQGSGHINASELTSGVFYGYTVVDLRQLAENLGGDGVLAAELVERFVQMVATVSPGAKVGSTAPYAYSHLVLVESGRAQPRTLANAFLEPVTTRGDVAANAYRAIARHLDALDAMYGTGCERAHATLYPEATIAEKLSLAELAVWAKERTLAGVGA